MNDISKTLSLIFGFLRGRVSASGHDVPRLAIDWERRHEPRGETSEDLATGE